MTLVEGKRLFFQQPLREGKQSLAGKGMLARMDKPEAEKAKHLTRINHGAP